MVRFWKKIFAGNEEHPETQPVDEPKEIQLQSPRTLLIWIDPTKENQIARHIRALALIEAFRRVEVETILLPSASRDYFREDFQCHQVRWLENVSEISALSIQDVIQKEKPNMTLADIGRTSFARIFAEIRRQTFLVSIGEKLEEIFFSANAVLLPEIILTPNFETLSLSPSRLGRCIHGERYLPLPSSYTERAAKEEMSANPLVFLLSSRFFTDKMFSLIKQLHTNVQSKLLIIYDAKESEFNHWKEDLLGVEFVSLHESVEKRLQTLNQARMGILPFSSPSYELMALGKPTLLLAHSKEEKELGQLFAEKGIAKVISMETEQYIDSALQIAQELWENDSLRETIGTTAEQFFPKDGAKQVVEELIFRFSRSIR